MATGLVVAIGTLATACSDDGSAAVAPATTDAFYGSAPTVNPALPPGPDQAPGTIARAEPIDGLPDGHQGWRVLYWSRDSRDQPVLESGMVFRPAGHGDDPVPVVAWAHQTAGVADSCAPSRSASSPGPAILDLLDAGVAVAAADYEGLGLPGLTHPYLDGVSAAHSVLDSVRAARNLDEAHVSASVGVWGYSQGGHAALFAAQLAAAYAPELDVFGVVASDPPATSNWLEENLLDEDRFQFGLFAVSSWSARDPALDPHVILTDSGADLAESVRDENAAICPDPNAAVDDEGLDSLVHGAFADDPQWSEALGASQLPELGAPMPVLILQGRNDKIVPVDEALAAARILCTAGSTVELRLLPGGHTAGMTPAAVTTWFTERAYGVPATTSCESLP